MTLDNSLISDTFMYSYTMDLNTAVNTMPANSCYTGVTNSLILSKNVSCEVNLILKIF